MTIADVAPARGELYRHRYTRRTARLTHCRHGRARLVFLADGREWTGRLSTFWATFIHRGTVRRYDRFVHEDIYKQTVS